MADVHFAGVDPVLQRQGCAVRALVRAGSERKLPAGCEVVVGSEGIDIESVYHLVKEGDAWKIDSAEIK